MSNDVSPDELAAVGGFSVQFVLFIILWNQAESTARRILQLMLGESETAMALSVELQNRSLSNALSAGARDPQFAHIKAELRHLIKGYDILLTYRNHHAHGLLGINPQGGVMLKVSGKGRLSISRTQSTMEDLEALKNSVSDWIGFAAAIEQELGADGDGLSSLIDAFQASLQKPQWPAQLKNTPLYLQEQ